MSEDKLEVLVDFIVGEVVSPPELAGYSGDFVRLVRGEHLKAGREPFVVHYVRYTGDGHCGVYDEKGVRVDGD